MKAITFIIALAVAAALAWATAKADDADSSPGRQLPEDQLVDVGGGVQVACTGVGDEARYDPRWSDFSVRMEFAGGDAQFLSDLDISVEGNGVKFDVSCNSPMLIADLPPGKYRLRAGFENLSKSTNFTAPKSGQARVVVRFEEVRDSRD